MQVAVAQALQQVENTETASRNNKVQLLDADTLTPVRQDDLNAMDITRAYAKTKGPALSADEVCTCLL